MTILTHGILNGLGLPYERAGTALFSVHGQFALEIEAPCSGIRSLLALTAITALYGYLTQKTLLKKWLLFLSAVPLAVIGNMARILTIALISEAFGQEVGTGLYHDFAGYLIFLAVSIPLMIGLGNLLDTNFREAWKRWKRALLHPTLLSSA
jgi:exosortase